MEHKRIIAICAPLILFFVMAHADDGDDLKDQFNPVMTAVTSQSIAADARAAGLGDIGAATDPDVNSQSWNPAKYPFTISRAGLAINYTLMPPVISVSAIIRPSAVPCVISPLAMYRPAT